MTPDRKILNQPLYSPLFYYLRETARSLHRAISDHRTPESVVVDLACLDKPYQPLFEGIYGTYIGIDYLPTEQGTIDIRADAALLPLCDNSVDILLCTEAIEHFREPELAVREVHRVLRPGGVAIFTVPLLFQKHSAADYRRWTDIGIRRLFTGFSSVECTPVGNSITCIVSLLCSYIISLFPPEVNLPHSVLMRKNIFRLIPKLFVDLFFIFQNIIAFPFVKLVCNTELVSSYLVVAKK